MAPRTLTLSGRTASEARFFTTRRGAPAAVFDLALDRFDHEGLVRYSLSSLEGEDEEPCRISRYVSVFAFGARARLCRDLGKERAVRVTGRLELVTRVHGGREITDGRMTLETLGRSGLDAR